MEERRTDSPAPSVRPGLPAAYWTPIGGLQKWLKNPRKNQRAVPQVARSIRKYGFVAPVVVWQSRRRLVAGHTRILALESILQAEPGFVPRDAPGVGLVPVRYHEFTDEAEANAYALADNKLNEAAEWDSALLAEVMTDLRASDETLLADTGFSEDEISSLLSDPDGAAGSAGADDDDPGAPPPSDELLKKWGCATGDLWIVEGTRGEHRLVCGDCRRLEDVARLMGDERASIAFTSPPYASQRAYDERSEFRPIPPAEYVAWFEAVQANVRQHLAADGSWFVNIRSHAADGERDLYVYDLVVAHKRSWGWLFVDDLVWVRAGVPGGWNNRFKNSWEGVYHFATQPQIKFRPDAVSHKTKHAFDYSPANGKSVSGSGLLGKEHAASFREGLARPGNVIEIGTGGAKVSGAHPAEFPVGLPRWFLVAYSDAGDVVYEPFAGSGSTLLAAEQTGRMGRGMEISPRYCAVILERLAAAGLKPRRAT